MATGWASALICMSSAGFASAQTQAPAEADGNASATASADPAASPGVGASEPEPDNKIVLASQPVPQNRRTHHMHDGFYLRASFGIGSLWANLNDSGVDDYDVDADGTGIGFDLLIGGSPSPGFSIGGGLISNVLFSSNFEQDGDVVEDRDISSGLVGVFVDGHPNKTGPWHLGGLIGLAGLAVNQDRFVDQTGGFGGAVWGGYDQWVAPDWSMGGLLRLTATHTTGDERVYDVSASAIALTLSMTALYH
jgi:hypothetical protein